MVLILTDSLRRDHSVDGSTPWGLRPPLHLPTMRRLARGGTTFENAYAASPLCSPSRQTLYQGRNYAAARPAQQQCHANQAWMQTGTTLHRGLARVGYAVLHVGVTAFHHPYGDLAETGLNASSWTMHNMQVWRAACTPHRPNKLDFGLRCSAPACGMTSDSFVDWLRRPEQRVCGRDGFDAFVDHFAARASHWPTGDRRVNVFEKGMDEATAVRLVEAERRACALPRTHHHDSFIAERAVRMWRERDRRRPTFLEVDFTGPHPPSLLLVRGNNGSVRCARGAGGVVGLERCRYAAHVEETDRLMGVVLDAVLPTAPLVVVSSDHGEMLWDRQLTGKTVPWQGSISIPLVFAGPGVRAGATVPLPVLLPSVTPTLLQLAGAPRAFLSSMTEPSLVPLLRGGLRPAADADVRWVHVELATASGAWHVAVLRTRRGRLVKLVQDARFRRRDDVAVYDLSADPSERLECVLSHRPDRDGAAWAAVHNGFLARSAHVNATAIAAVLAACAARLDNLPQRAR